MSAMRTKDGAIAIRVLLVAVLVLVWIATWLVLDAALTEPASSEPGRGGIPGPVLFGGLAMCVYAGALARFAGRRGRSPWAGVGAGMLLATTYLLGSVASELLRGSFGQLAEGETAFSTLIELPFWLAFAFVPTALCGVAGWLVGAAIARATSKPGTP